MEAIFIEYAIIDDRLESVLRHSEKLNPNKHKTLKGKLSRIKEMQREKKGLVKKYFTDELIGEVCEWKEERNRLIHALMKQLLHTEDLESVALQGEKIAKTVSNKTKSYNTTLKKIQEK